jgi:hypothetical protein
MNSVEDSGDGDGVAVARTSTRDELQRLQLRHERHRTAAREIADDVDALQEKLEAQISLQRKIVAGAFSLLVAAVAALGGGLSLLQRAIAEGERRAVRLEVLEDRVRIIEERYDRLITARKGATE